MKTTMLITGATGATGRPATKLLLERGHSVRAFVHREDDRSKRIEDLGAEVALPVGFAAALLCGAVVGIINGLVITRLRVPDFIATLAMLGVA